jgi:Pro-kumamolisin, activation domain/Putative Ig domain
MLNTFKSAVTMMLVGAAVAIGPMAPTMAETARPLVVQGIDERQTVELAGNVRPEAAPANDRGLVSDRLLLDHLELLLKRPAETEAALEAFIDQLHDPKSPAFHQWLTADEFAANFAPAASDLQSVALWLRQHGFVLNGVRDGGMIVDFSGTAGAVRDAFHTEIHNLDVDGVPHIANMTNPRIPAALGGAVTGIVALHDFRPHRHMNPRPEYTIGSNSPYEAVVPADLATIYNLNPLFSAGISGQGQTVVVIEDTDVFSAADWTTFRSTFGLSSYTAGNFVQVHPAPKTGGNNCSDPGVLPGNESEAELDAEWASASAPSATIELAACSDTNVAFGGLIALQNLIGNPNPPAIVSISYGECEAYNGAAANAVYAATYQQAVALGISIFVSSGDEGAASCDADQSAASHGVGVSGFASTPYNVAVGGTDYGDTYAGTTSTYWNTQNTSVYGSAKSYIPEIPWNDSCASTLFSTYFGSSVTYGSTGFCNSATGQNYFLTTASGSGGPSGCAAGNASAAGIVSGTCQGYAKPSWQSLVGNPADGVRDIPDVSLFAANGAWGHYYVFCDSDAADGGSCSGAPSNWSGAGGTSFSSPIMAGIQALVNQKTGSAQGNPNPTYYAMAAAEYGAAGSASCNSSNGNMAAQTCVFYDVTLGDMDVNCTGTIGCYLPSGSNGVLSLSRTAYQPAFATHVGWDFATGIGTINAANLVNHWGAATTPLAISSAASLSTKVGAATSFTATATGGKAPYTWSVKSSLPAGLSIAAATGIISGTPTTAGIFAVTLGVKDSLAATATQAFTITVNAAEPLTISSAAGAMGEVSAPFSFKSTNTGGAAPFTWSIATGTLPSGLSIASTTGIVSGTPSAAGSAAVMVQVTDSLGTVATKSFTPTILARLAITSTASLTGTAGMAVSFTPAVSGGLGPYTWSIQTGSLPSGLKLNSATGATTGTTTATGQTALTLKVADSLGASNTQSFALTINVPFTITSAAAVKGEVSLPFAFTPTSAGGTAPLTWSLAGGTLPTGLTIAASTGTISGTPMTSGASMVTLKVTGASGASATQSLSFAIEPKLAITSSTGVTVFTGTPLSFTPSASGGLGPDTWSISAGSLPNGLSINASTGTISGTTAIASGAPTVTLKVVDALGNAAMQALTLTIATPVTITSNPPATGEVSLPFAFTPTTKGGSGTNLWSLSAALPSGLSFNTATGAIAGTPRSSVASTIKLTVQNNQGSSASQSFTLTILPEVTIVAPESLTVTHGVATVFTPSPTGGKGPFAWSVSAGTLPSGLAINAATGVISGTAKAAGSASITLTIVDALGVMSTHGLSITVK